MRVPDSARRFAVGSVIFCGAMAVVVWQAGGIASRGTTPAPRDPDRAANPPGTQVVPMAPGAGMGSGRGVRVSKEGIAVVDGEPIPFVIWEGEWDTQRPLPGKTIDERRLLTEGFSVLLFHQRPTAEEPRPRAVEGPDTTRITADEAELQLGSDAAFQAALIGNVRIVRHAADGDLTLLTDSLDLEQTAGEGQDESVHATSEVHVVVEGSGMHLEGTGLDADLGRDGGGGRGDGDAGRTQLTLRKDVEARFLAARGAATPQGSFDAAELVTTTITCTSAATLQNIRAGTDRQPSRWLATFRENVVVTQSPTILRCQTFEVEFELAPKNARASRPQDGGRSGSAVKIVRALADGQVVVEGRDPDTDAGWSLRCGKSITRRDDKGGYDVDLLGGTTLKFDGTLRGRSKSGEQGRVEVRCSGPAILHSDPEAAQPGLPVRGRITFQDDVVARQWGAAGELESEVRAPQITLHGSRTQTGDTRLDPETLIATGTAAERVHIHRGTLTATTRVLTWRVLRREDIERLLLSGRPAATFEDTSGLNPLGARDSKDPATLFLNAEDALEFEWRHTPSTATPDARPYATAKARGNVVLRRVMNERETYRLSANSLDVAFDAAMNPTRFRAYDNVQISGRGDRAGDRHVVLRGDRMAAGFVAASDGATQLSRTELDIFGQPDRPATCDFQESKDDSDDPRRHHIEAEHLSYQESGTLVVARRHALVQLERMARDPDTGKPLDLTISGGLLRIHLRPNDAENGESGRPEVLRIEGERGVTLETPAAVVNGQTITYDRITGIAIATGSPARVILFHTKLGDARWGGTLNQLDSIVTSDEIRAEFDTTAKGDGRPRRMTCSGGRLRFFQNRDAQADDASPTRVSLTTTGPIEVLPESASATGDVELIWETRLPNGRLHRDARLLADRVEFTFDMAAKGSVRDRVKRAIATGSRARPARLFSPTIDATADKMESESAWINLLAPWGRAVRVTRRDPPESFTCKKARYNYLTEEFEATGADYSQSKPIPPEPIKIKEKR